MYEPCYWLCTRYTRGKYRLFFFFFLFPLHLYFKFETNVFSVDEIGMKKREGVAAESSLARIQKGLAKLAGPYLNNRVVRREGDAEIRGSVSRS